MTTPDHENKPINRRDFIKMAALSAGVSAGASLIAACTRANESLDFQVDIVQQQNFVEYAPASLVIPTGATVTWLNKSYYSQSVTCDTNKASNNKIASLPNGATPFDSGILFPGQTYTRKFETPGTYIYFSISKLDQNTTGTIFVR